MRGNWLLAKGLISLVLVAILQLATLPAQATSARISCGVEWDCDSARDNSIADGSMNDAMSSRTASAAGDPYDVANERIYRVDADFAISAGNGLSLGITRIYSTDVLHIDNANGLTTFGPQWHCNYNEALYDTSTGFVTHFDYVDEMGQLHYLDVDSTWGGGGTRYITPIESGSRIVAFEIYDSSTLEGYQIIRDNDRHSYFDEYGRLIYQGRNPYNTLDSDALDMVDPTYSGAFYEGVRIKYFSDDDSDPDFRRIETVTAPNGRYLKFYYNSTFVDQCEKITYYKTSEKDVYYYYYDSNGMLSFTKEYSGSNTAAMQYEYGSWNGTTFTTFGLTTQIGRITRWTNSNDTPLVAYQYNSLFPTAEWRYDPVGSDWRKRISYVLHDYDVTQFIFKITQHMPNPSDDVDTYLYTSPTKKVKKTEFDNFPAGVNYPTLKYEPGTSGDTRDIVTKRQMLVGGGSTYKTAIEWNYVDPSTVDQFYAYRLESIDRYRTDGGTAYTTYFDYDSIYGHKPSLITDPVGNETELEYYNYTDHSGQGHLWGLLLSTTDPDNRTTTYSYDSQARLVEIEYPDSTTVEITYDSAGFVDSYTNRLGHETLFTYNDWGQIKTVENYLGQTVTYRYTVTGDGTPPITHNPPYLYKTELPGSRSISYTHNDWGQVTGIEDALSNDTTITYDEQGRQTAVINALSEQRVYQYDDLDRLTTFFDGNDNATTYTYDPFGRLWTIADDDDETTTLTYTGDFSCGCAGSDGSLIQQVTDPLGNTVYYGYNLQGMLTEQYWQVGSGSVETWLDNIEYDDLGNLTEVRDLRLKYGSTNIGDRTFRYEYDATQRRLLAEVYPTGRRMEMTYETSGLYRPLTAKGPWGHVSKMTYDSFSRPDKVTDSFGGEIDYIYYPSGDDRLHKTEMPNGMVTEITYDSLERVGKIEHFNTSLASLEKFEFTYNNGDLITRVDNNSSKYVEYQYDNAYRLTRETLKPSVSRDIKYFFDNNEAGNRNKRSDWNGSAWVDTTFAHNNLNQVTSKTVSSVTTDYIYDDAGNLTEKKIGSTTIWSATYRPGDDRMAAVTTGGLTTNYVYDFAGRKILRVDDDDTGTAYYYNGLTVVAEESYTVDTLARIDEFIDIADTEASSSPDTNGWGIESGGSGTYYYVTDSLRGKALRWNGTGSSKLMIGDRGTTNSNSNDTPWGSVTARYLSLWMSKTTTASHSISVFCDTTFGANSELIYYLASGTNSFDSANDKMHFYLGSDWSTTVGWQHFQRDLQADIQSLSGSDGLYEVNGLGFVGSRFFLDDITLGPGARSVVRHAGGEWTPGATHWPSGGLDHDTAAYHYYDHLGNLKGRTGANGLALGSQWDYDAFGRVTSGTAADYEHTGNHYDADAGVFYFNNRWYDNDLGRFTQRNTPYQPVYEHPYAISEGDPVNWIDPTGFEKFRFRIKNPDKPKFNANGEFEGEYEDDLRYDCQVEISDKEGEAVINPQRLEDTLTSVNFARTLEHVREKERLAMIEKLTNGDYTYKENPTPNGAIAEAVVHGTETTLRPPWNNVHKTPQDRSNTLVHELGHSIGLSHKTPEKVKEGEEARIPNWHLNATH